MVFFPDKHDKNARCEGEAYKNYVLLEFPSVAAYGCCAAPSGRPEDLIGLGIENYSFDVHAVFHARNFVPLDFSHLTFYLYW